MKATMVFGGVSVSCEGDAKEVFAELAGAAEVFGQSFCGNCGSELVIPVVRDVDGNTYYEMRCQSCRCTLGFGQRKIDGKLYPRRKGKDGEWLTNNGWADHRPKQADNVEAPF